MSPNPFEIPDFTPKEVNNDTRNVFGNTLREAREASGKTLGQIATELGISEEECLEFETGKKKPDRSKLKDLTTAYGAMDDELRHALDSFHGKSSHHKKDRKILPTYPISRSGRVGPHHGLGDNKVD